MEGQPLAANVDIMRNCTSNHWRPGAFALKLQTHSHVSIARDARALQHRLDNSVLLVVALDPEVRVKVGRGPARAGCSRPDIRRCSSRCGTRAR